MFTRIVAVSLAAVVTWFSAGSAHAQSLGTAFTYQGELRQDGVPASGTHHLRFQLWDALTGGTQIGSDIDFPAVSPEEGRFTVPLDFGSTAFAGSARWLQVQVITNGGATVTTLVPRQAITAAPYALHALGASGSGVTNINASNITSGALAASHLPAGGNWSLSSSLNLDAGTLAVDAANNRVGVGTAAPQQPLHVLTAGQTSARFESSSQVPMVVEFRNTSSSTTWDQGVNGTITPFQGPPGSLFWQKQGNAAPALIMTPTDRIGIGTPTVVAKLHVRSVDALLPVAHFESASSTGLLITPDSRVGIGTTTPGAKFHVANGDILAGETGQEWLFHTRSGFGGDFLHISQHSNGVPFGWGLVITDTQRVGINKTNPEQALDVTGRIRAENNFSFEAILGLHSSTQFSGTGVRGVSLSATGSNVGVAGQCNSPTGFDFNATGAGINYGATSSKRWKHNIKPISDPLERVEQMRGVYFDWDAEHGGHHDVGFIAEEVGKVLPEIVQYEENGIDASGMDYSKLTPLLAEAIKALQAQTEAELAALQAAHESLRAAHQAELDSLRASNDTLRRELEELRRTVKRISDQHQTAD